LKRPEEGKFPSLAIEIESHLDLIIDSHASQAEEAQEEVL
jgi:hypothetical protein